MPGTNGAGRVGGCGVLGAEGGRVGAGAGTDSGPAGGGGGAVAIGRRPAHPAKSSAARNEEISQLERGSDARNADRCSVTRDTVVFRNFQCAPLPFSACMTRISRPRAIPAIIGMRNFSSKETTCHFPFDGATNWTAGAAKLRPCFTLSRRPCARGSARHAGRWSAQRPRSAISAVQT